MFSDIIFIAEILVAEFLLTCRLKRRKFYVLRLALFAAVSFAVACFVPFVDSVWYTCLVYLLLFAMTLPGLKFIYNEPWINILFCGIAAYTTQHMAYQFTNLVFTLVLWGESPLLGLYHVGEVDISGWSLETLFWIAVYVMGYFTMYAIGWFFFGRKIEKNEDMKVKAQSFLFLISGCLILNIVLNAVAVYSEEPESVVSAIVRQVSAVFNCLLLLRWQFELLSSGRLRSELDLANKLLWQAQNQYRISKENIDLINLKCHDMKHQIREIGNSKRLDREIIEDLERSISVYDSVVKTDNEALDIILTEKSFKCLKNDIILNCIADGKQLNFMKNSDVYSLFGNALDNAIEAVLGLRDKQKRVIGLKVWSVGGLITVNVRNFYEGNIELDGEGLPRTTKSDKEQHGFGLRSIRQVAEKYGGNLSVALKDDIFNLNVLIPVVQA